MSRIFTVVRPASRLPTLWRTRAGLPQRIRLDLFETEALVNVLAPGDTVPSSLDVHEAHRVITALHSRGGTVECDCQEHRAPTLVPSVTETKVALLPRGPRHANDCVLRVVDAPEKKPAAPLMQLVKTQRHAVDVPNPFGSNNLSALIRVPTPGG